MGVRCDTESNEVMGKAIGSVIQIGVGQLLPFEDHSNCIRRFLNLFLE
ncbi:hypothetical protein ACPOL_3340 [Acidisarcina polymorpha]|uniref:Uncharacterized protein n=1 Tax=Acidisarcina polymorpha TaxID=2211140 RepID=A0A2Z5G0E7_9BACT|nr:hypothetical protein ACPOL_3340 [Acidisarcina polymorpha]